jgi:hypothetical protein
MNGLSVGCSLDSSSRVLLTANLALNNPNSDIPDSPSRVSTGTQQESVAHHFGGRSDSSTSLRCDAVDHEAVAEPIDFPDVIV